LLRQLAGQNISVKDSQEIEKKLKPLLSTSSDEKDYRWARYSQALVQYKAGKKEQSCQSFTELARDDHFPLHELSQMRSYAVCELDTKTRKKAYRHLFKPKNKWYRDVGIELGIEISKRMGDKIYQAQFLLARSKESRVLVQKIEDTEKALELVKNAKQASLIHKLTRRLYALSPSENPHPRPSQMLRVAYDLRKAGELKKARHIYHQIIANKKRRLKDRLAAYRGLRLSYKQDREMDLYLKSTESWVKFTQKLYNKKSNSRHQKEYEEAKITLVRTLWTLGKTSEALTALDEYILEFKGKSSLAEAYWLKARIFEEKKQYSDTLAMSELALSEVKPKSELWEKIMWQRAWNFRKLKIWSSAIKEFETLLAGLDANDYTAKYEFWYALTQKEVGNKKNFKEILEKLIDEEPLSYYSLVAHKELGIDFNPIPSLDEGEPERVSFVTQKEDEALRWLLSLGEQETLSSALHDLWKRLRRSKERGADRNRIYHWTYEAGDYQLLFRRLSDLGERPKLFKEKPQWFFPRPHQKEVQKAVGQFGIPEEIIYAIMRQESSFNPHARSPADAYGLMQLTLPTAQRVAKERDITVEEGDHLFDPHVNIELGSAFLKKLLDMFDDQALLTAAAYNASERVVAQWLKIRFDGNSLEFIEDIPYAETMNYVKLVLRNYLYYSRLKSPGQKVAFPDSLLEGFDQSPQIVSKD